LDVETVDLLYQEKGEDWFRTKLGHVKTLVISFFTGCLQEAHLEALKLPYNQEGGIDHLASPFHWLMRRGLPRFSILNVTELRISG
jgi:hypothetical protein